MFLAFPVRVLSNMGTWVAHRSVQLLGGLYNYSMFQWQPLAFTGPHVHLTRCTITALASLASSSDWLSSVSSLLGNVVIRMNEVLAYWGWHLPAVKEWFVFFIHASAVTELRQAPAGKFFGKRAYFPNLVLPQAMITCPNMQSSSQI